MIPDKSFKTVKAKYIIIKYEVNLPYYVKLTACENDLIKTVLECYLKNNELKCNSTALGSFYEFLLFKTLFKDLKGTGIEYKPFIDNVIGDLKMRKLGVLRTKDFNRFLRVKSYDSIDEFNEMFTHEKKF